MIKYDRLFQYIKKAGISEYRLIKSGINHSTLSRLKHNQPASTETLDKICTILDCNLEDIVAYTKDEAK